jgi:hypothetical protein
MPKGEFRWMVKCVKPFLFDHAAVTRKLRSCGEIVEKHALPLRNIYLLIQERRQQAANNNERRRTRPRFTTQGENDQKQARPDLSFGNTKLVACCLTDGQSVYGECGDNDKSSKRGETAGLNR